MKTRVLSAVAATILLIVIVFLPKEVLALAVFLIAVIGLYEFYSAVRKVGFKPLNAAGYILCLPLLYLGIFHGDNKFEGLLANLMSLNGLILLMYLVLVLLLCLLVFSKGRISLADLAMTIFGAIYITFLAVFIILTRNLENGAVYIWFIFIGAWVTDSCAYLVGVSIGKNKLMPSISPNKTIEGAIGGVAGCIAGMIVFGLLVNKYIGDIAYHHFLIMGFICGIVSQIGDWTASAIKRWTSIKDFGKIMPGHGGVLDRCDSLLFTAAAVYFYIVMFI
jgi:phosphatidate cytidylyltransferase